MSMFDWSAKAGSPVVSERFWIYWATAGPLTIIVVTGWYIWFRRDVDYEKEHFQSAKKTLNRQATERSEKRRVHGQSTNLFLRLRGRKREKEVAEDVEATVVDQSGSKSEGPL